MGVFVAAWPSVILIAALPEIADDLGSSESAMSWVVTLPLLVGSVLLPTFGKLGDLRGHRKVFLIGLGACGVTRPAHRVRVGRRVADRPAHDQPGRRAWPPSPPPSP